jgi:uncharacterized caspase-like protein
LETPEKDVQYMKEVLESSGIWKVDILLNATKQEIEKKVFEFAQSHKGEVKLLFYTGHGAQGENNLDYLLPVGTEFNSRTNIKYNAVPTNYLVDQLAEAESKMSIVILDACRNDIGKGVTSPVFAGINSSSFGGDYYIIHAAQSGNTVGEDSYLTKSFVESMKEHGKKSMGELLEKTVALVKETTKGNQRPEIRQSSSKRFCMFGCDGNSGSSGNGSGGGNSQQPPSCEALNKKVEERGILNPSEQQFYDRSCGRNG